MPLDLEKIKSSVQNGTEVIVKKSQDFVEISSLKLKISSVEKKIDQLYIKIGKQFYKQYNDNKYSNNDLIKICKEINELQEEIQFYKTKIEKIKK